MSNEELNNALYAKMQEEQDAYRGWLLSQPPEEILRHTYEYTVRKDIMVALENNNLSDEQASALLKSESPLADVYKEFCKIETGYMDTLRDTLEGRADAVIQREQESRKALRNLPVYRNSGSYARENNELEQYRESRKANIACKDAINQAISENYGDNRLNVNTAIKQVVDAFGYDRMLYVLANTIQHKEWDGRFSSANKRWAASQPIPQDVDGFGSDRNVYFVVDRAHPGLVDMFSTYARKEYLLTQPLAQSEIVDEAKRIHAKLQREQAPNSPNKTHFMAEISPDFLKRAGTKDMKTLQGMFPFKSLAFTTMKDRKGVFAVIAADENRSRKLREPRESVLAKLQQPPPTTSPNISAKSRNPER